MTKFITLNALNSESSENDVIIHVRTDQIKVVQTAGNADKRRRKEINAIISTPFGAFACAEAACVILERIEAAESDLPEVAEELTPSNHSLTPNSTTQRIP